MVIVTSLMATKIPLRRQFDAEKGHLHTDDGSNVLHRRESDVIIGLLHH